MRLIKKIQNWLKKNHIKLSWSNKTFWQEEKERQKHNREGKL